MNVMILHTFEFVFEHLLVLIASSWLKYWTYKNSINFKDSLAINLFYSLYVGYL